MDFKLTHARHDPAHCLTPGLFRSLKRGEQKKVKLDVTHRFGEEVLRFTGFEPLDRSDMRILQGLIAMSGPAGVALPPEQKTPIGKQLWTSLGPKHDAADQDALVVKTTVRGLLNEIGKTGSGDNIKGVKDSLHRMANVSVLVQKGKQQAVFHMLSYAFDEGTGQLFVALNQRVTEAVLGERSNAYISMSEVRALDSDPAAFMHQRLSAWIDPGKSGKVDIDTLCSYVWYGEVNAEATKKRRQAVRKGLTELVGLGWTVEEYYRGKFSIGRPL